MDIFKNRRSARRDIALVFASCVVPVYSWSILAFLEKLPSWLLHLSLWDLIGAFAYTQAFAFLESGVILLGLIALLFVLPERFFSDRFVAQGSMLVLVTSVWAAAFQINVGTVRLWSLKIFLLWSTLYAVSIGIVYVLVHRYKRLEQSLYAFTERLAVLLYVYIPITILSFLAIVIRNI